MKIAMLQLNFTVGDFPGNVEKIVAGYNKAVAQGAELVVSTELALSGYPPLDLLERGDFLKAQTAAMEVLRPNIGKTPLVFGAATKNKYGGKPLFNSAMIARNGRIEQVTTKTLVPTYDVFDELRYFEPRIEDHSECFLMQLKRNGRSVHSFWGVLICEDLWYEESLPQNLYAVDPSSKFSRNLEGVIVINASPWHYGKLDTRFELVQNVARKLKCPAVYVNQVGGNDELIFDGNSFAVDAEGICLALAKSFEEDMVIVDTDESDSALIPSETIGDVEKALCLGVRDYVSKCGFKKAVIGLSGGVDSTVTACVAVKALGPENVLGALMPSPISSQGSVDDSLLLAKNLGIPTIFLPIEKALNSYDGIFGTPLADTPRENIQARIRGNMLMAISNKFGHLVLSTGNKSELAVGYCTLYGDMCGGLSVLADVPKTMVYELARHFNRDGIIIPQIIIDKPPSAELRENQTDQDDLPPYDILDAIIDRYVVRGESINEITASGFDYDTVDKIVKKIERNEFKRRQAAPGLKITSKAFGMGRRFPVAWRKGY